MLLTAIFAFFRIYLVLPILGRYVVPTVLPRIFNLKCRESQALNDFLQIKFKKKLTELLSGENSN